MCPDCHIVCAGPEELQIHYGKVHEPISDNRGGDVHSLRQEINDLKASLQVKHVKLKPLK